MLQVTEVKNGADLRQWRKERGWNQSKVALMLQSSQKTISNMEGRPYEPLSSKIIQALMSSENPAEARLIGQWQTTFGQALDHMQRHGMLPALQTKTVTNVSRELARVMGDALHKEGVQIIYE